MDVWMAVSWGDWMAVMRVVKWVVKRGIWMVGMRVVMWVVMWVVMKDAKRVVTKDVLLVEWMVEWMVEWSETVMAAKWVFCLAQTSVDSTAGHWVVQSGFRWVVH